MPDVVDAGDGPIDIKAEGNMNSEGKDILMDDVSTSVTVQQPTVKGGGE